MRGFNAKYVKQVNNITIFYCEDGMYRCTLVKKGSSTVLIEFGKLEEAVEWCEKTKDYLKKKGTQ